MEMTWTKIPFVLLYNLVIVFLLAMFKSVLILQLNKRICIISCTSQQIEIHYAH